MNLNKNRLIFSLATLVLIIAVSFLVYQKEQKKLALTTQKTTIKNILKTTPLNYAGSTLLNEFNKTTIENYPTAAGTYDLATMASEITSQMLQAFSATTTKTLPLVANWNVGIPEYSDGLDPLYMINRLTNGEHIVPTWKLDPYYNDSIGLSYYETSIKKAAELGLPLVFTLPSPESALIKDDVYFTMDKTNNPNVITPKGIVLPKLSPFGPNSLWNEVGKQWSTTSLMAQLQEWYPNPPLIIFIDEDSASKLSWSELNSSSRYQTQYPSDGTDEFKRTLVNAQWVEKYRQLHKGFYNGFTNKNWRQNSRFISRNQLAINMGTTNNWRKSATTTNLHTNIWPLTTDGLTIDIALDGNKTLLNNLPFMLDEAKAINPNFVTQLSIDGHQNITDTNKYRGYTQLVLWLLRPNIIRQTSHEDTKANINPLFQEVVNSIELINNSNKLADFWKNGKLVKTSESKYNINIPPAYKTLPRNFFLETNVPSPVYAFALTKGVAPNREWLVYVQSPEGNLTDVTVTIPEYKNIIFNTTSSIGDFYIIKESIDQIKNATNNVSFVLIPDEHPFHDKRIKPNEIPNLKNINNIVNLAGCRGEIKSFSIILFTKRSLENISVKTSKLTSSSSEINSSAIDIRTVKWWYQNKGGKNYLQNIVKSTNVELKPELLLKNDSLVIANLNKKINKIKFTNEQNITSYYNSSFIDTSNLKLYDSKTLQPIKMDANKSKEFWINIDIPDNIDPGDYNATISFSGTNSEKHIIKLHLKVYSFHLKPSPIRYSIYWQSKICNDSALPSLQANKQSCRSVEQYTQELINIKQHGILYPINYRSLSYLKGIKKMLDIRQKLKMPNDAFFTVSYGKGTSVPLERIPAWIQLLNNYGYKDKYFYGIDEAKVNELHSEKDTFNSIQSLGGKTFVSIDDIENLNTIINDLGNSLNIYNLARETSSAYSSAVHAFKSQAYSYGNPPSGTEGPEIYRLNYGISLWKKNYDGAMIFAYQYAYRSAYDDNDDALWRDHMFTYPTTNGVIDTIAWEGMREATYDVRYLYTLQSIVDNSPKDNPIRIKAKQWIDNLDLNLNLDDMRTTTIQYIQKLYKNN